MVCSAGMHSRDLDKTQHVPALRGGGLHRSQPDDRKLSLVVGG